MANRSTDTLSPCMTLFLDLGYVDLSFNSHRGYTEPLFVQGGTNPCSSQAIRSTFCMGYLDLDQLRFNAVPKTSDV